MATYLELVQRVTSESGTVKGDAQPPTVTGQSGRLRRLVNWTNDAWRAIQNQRSHWQWMRGEFEGQTVGSTQRYAGSVFVPSRFADFVYTGSPSEGGVSLFRTSDGPDGEGPLAYLAWPDFHQVLLRGANRSREGRPSHFTITPAGELALWPTPDAAYTVRGLYRKDVQTLSADGDVPEMPSRFHDLIVWKALIYLAAYDESVVQEPRWRLEAARIMSELERDQLPRITVTGPLA
jgi:hypothetical protein